MSNNNILYSKENDRLPEMLFTHENRKQNGRSGNRKQKKTKFQQIQLKEAYQKIKQEERSRRSTNLDRIQIYGEVTNYCRERRREK